MRRSGFARPLSLATTYTVSVLAQDPADRPVLWQVGPRALGFAAHPGLKVAMVEDLIMEFEESPANAEAELTRLRSAQRALEDALVPIMTGVVWWAGWMDEPGPRR